MANFTNAFSVPVSTALTNVYTASNTTQITRVFVYNANAGAAQVQWAIVRGVNTYLQNQASIPTVEGEELLPSAQTLIAGDIVQVQTDQANDTTFTLNLIENL